MKIDQLVLGAYQTNCYILRTSEKDAECLLIDTGLDAGGLIDFLQKHKLIPLAIVLTHDHADHISGIPLLRENFPHLKVYIHKLAVDATDTEPDILLVDDGDVIEQAQVKLNVLHTPGHTQSGICLYSHDQAIVFTDDTLFVNSVGRTDLPGGNREQLISSIKQKLLTLPDDTVVYPGHGPSTTIAHEKATNPFLQ